MKRLILLSIAILFASFAMAQTAGQDIDVIHYDIHLSQFDFAEKTFQGVTEVDFKATNDITSVVLELKTLEVSEVTCPQYPIAGFEQDGDLLIVHFASTIPTDAVAELTIAYGGQTFNESWGGVHWNGEYVYNLGVGFDSQPHNLGKTWFPCVDNFTDKARYDVTITAENGKKAICGGNLASTTDNGDGTTTWHWVMPQEIATYHISFTVGDYELWEDASNGIPVTVYARPATIAKVPGSFVNIKEIMAFYEECFGIYPFNRIGYVGTPIGSMEHVDNIFLANSLITGNTSGEGTIAHELSHMWFGNKVTCATAQDMWLNEGFAQFLGNFYIAGVYGEVAYHDAMSTIVNNLSSKCRTQNYPAINAMPLDMTYDGNAVYDRGAAIVSTMMKYMGREKFLQGLRAYLDQYASGTASSEDLKNALTEATGIDMQGFFDTYVFVAGVPYYYVSIQEVNPVGEQYEVKLKMHYQHLNGEHVGMHNVYPVTFYDADFNLYNDTVCWDGATGYTTKMLDFEPVGMIADFDNDYLEAVTQKKGMLTTSTSSNYANVQIEVSELTDSVFFSIQNHPVGSYDDPLILGLTLSTSHFWTINRHDFGEAKVKGVFTYRNSNSFDGDIIHTENDSATLVYRANVSEPWCEIAHEVTSVSSWKLGQLVVDDLQSGEYAIAVWDKAHFGTDEQGAIQRRMQIFPNPADAQVNLSWNDFCNGSISIVDVQGRVVQRHAFSEANSLSVSTEGLAKGVYQVQRISDDGQVLETNNLIIK